MDMQDNEYKEVINSLEYYISNFIKNSSIVFFDDFKFEDFVIEKISDSSYQFSYKIQDDNEESSIVRCLSGFISKSYINLNVSKTISTVVSNEMLSKISYTIFKDGEFVLIDEGAEYFEISSTIKKVIDSSGSAKDFKEYAQRTKMFEFSDGNNDLLHNYNNLHLKKWPISKKLKSLSR